MDIQNARYTFDGVTVLASIGGVEMTIPADPANRHRQALATWIEAGGIVAPFEPPAERRLVPKRLIVDRLEAAGLLVAARAALDAAPLYDRERWNARESIYADDPTALALLAAIGADAEAILA